MRYLWLCVVVLTSAGCKSGPPYQSGFLDDYRKLERKGQRPNIWLWEKPGVDMREYDRLMIDPVEIRLLKGSTAGELGEGTLRKVALAFRRIMRDTIDPYYTVVTKPGPHVMLVRLAVTDVSPVKDGTEMGEATMEAELLDSVSGEQLAAAVERVKGSTGGKGQVPEEWRHVEGAFQEWADGLLDYMDRAHAPE